MTLPSQETLREWLNYDPGTGIFTWRKKPRGGRRREVGITAGTTRPDGYVFIGVGSYSQIGAHRLAWIHSYGPIPAGMEVDHKDTNPNNNRLDNLRLATPQENKRNRNVQSNSRSGLKGAYFHAAHKGKKWRSQLKLEPGTGSGKFLFLGYYDTALEAHMAYRAAAVEHYGEFARLS